MAGEIKHSWNGTVLTITSDSGTSSCDLKGRQGDDGIRGPQGPAGIVVDADGQLIFEGIATEQYVDDKIANIEISGTVDLSNYYTKAEIDATLENFETTGTPVDLTNYATKDYVGAKIAEAQLGGSGSNIDLTAYALKSDIPDISHLASESYVNSKIESLELTPGPKGDKGDKGDDGSKGDKGDDGYTPIKGVDYFTNEDKTEIVQLVLSSFGDAEDGEY